jgi:hypothetical protein
VPLVGREESEEWFIWLLSAPSLPSCALGYERRGLANVWEILVTVTLIPPAKSCQAAMNPE